MKGDFSRWAFDAADNLTGVLSQQGRVFTDPDITAMTQIAGHWRETLGRDAIGAAVVAVPADALASWRVVSAQTDGASVHVTLESGRAWVDGVHLTLPGSANVTLTATYLEPPLQSPPASPATIAANIRDAVVLEAWEDSVSAYQEPVKLLEPALGGPDTTERSRLYFALRLFRLGAGEDCASVASRLGDDLAARGTLTVTPEASVLITGDCPLEAGGGYTGLEHYLYRIEIAEPDGGEARFKWSQFNGGLVGRGTFASTGATTGTVTVTANDQAIDHCGLTDFYLEALTYDSALGYWRVALTADATWSQPGILALTGIQGTWPVAAPASAFFRLWNGIARIIDYPVSADPTPLKDGIRLEFEAPLPDHANYRPGDYWTFPVRAAGTPMDPSLWPANAPPQGIRHHRAPLAILHWQADRSAQTADGEIDDCRRVFRPLTRQKVCCTVIVGDGASSHGDVDSIEEALRQLPASGGQICLLPGLHQTNAEIRGRVNVRIVGCDIKSKVVPRRESQTAPIFRVIDSAGVTLEHMDLTTMGGTAVMIEGTRSGLTRDIGVAWNRILACTHAIRATQAQRLWIHHNRIRMLDKDGGDVAIYLNADDALVERNDIGVIPAPQMPPIDVPGGGQPVDPVDPCARFEIVYVNRPLFVHYVNLVWGLVLSFVVPDPYRTKGGIQLAGGCERVRLLENAIRGGGGNGVTLGQTLPAVQQPPEEPADEHRVSSVNGMIAGTVVPPSGSSPSGIQLSFTSVASGASLSVVTAEDGGFLVRAPDGAYLATVATPGLAINRVDVINLGSTRLHVLTLVAVAEPPEPEEFGFLYDIVIERNHIQGMGLSGIGVAPATAGARNTVLQSYLALLGQPVVGLLIAGNRIEHCLRNAFDAELRQEAARRGLGGVSLGYCEDLVLRENHIEANGLSHVTPVCGVYVSFGEDVEITLNRVIDNGPLAARAGDLIAGRRGGIVLNAVTSLALLDLLTGTGQVRASGRPAAIIHENVVDQPAGLALYVVAAGALVCTDNAFTSEVSGVSGVERMAGTVFVFNVGGIPNRPPASSFESKAGAVTEVAGEPGAGGPTEAAPAAVDQPKVAMGDLARPAAARLVLPGGATHFCNNQSRTGAANSSLSSHVIAAMDDLDYSHNHSANLSSRGVFANGLLTATTLRASGSRFSEAGPETFLSLLSVAGRLNATTFNQADHCILVVGMDPAYPEVQTGNMVLDNARCRSFNMIAEVSLKQRG